MRPPGLPTLGGDNVTRQLGSEGNDRDPVRVETVVIGAGQAGQATG